MFIEKNKNNNQSQTEDFLAMLDDANAEFNWRLLKSGGTPIKLSGTFEEHVEELTQRNNQGYGVFVMVNKASGAGQSMHDVTNVRALFADLDGCPKSNINDVPLKPHLVLETSPGKYHVYWKVAGIALDDFRAYQQSIAALCHSDPVVCDLPRIMRVPGFYHHKNEPYMSSIQEISDHPVYSAEDVAVALSENVTKLHPDTPNEHRPDFDFQKPLTDGQRTEALTHFCGKYIADGLSDELILPIMRDWNSRNNPPLEDTKLVTTLASIRRSDARNHPLDPLIEDLNQEYAVAPFGGKTVVIREHQNTIEYMSCTSFREFNSNLSKIEGKPAAQYWLNSPKRRTYQRIVFDPAMPAGNDECYNLWKGFSVEPEEAECSLYLQHIRDNIAHGNEELYHYILDWMADAVQNTDKLPGVALVLLGKQGTGKGIFARYFGQLFGQHYKHVQSANHLTGQFTQHLSNSVIIYADEVVWGGDKQREGVLKTLITEPTRLHEAKGKDAVQINNYARVIMSTNESWAVPAGIEERRYCVMEVNDAYAQDSAYFGAIVKQMDSGGLAGLLHFLQQRDLSQVNLRQFPKTDALLRQKELTLESVARWWLNCLKMGSINAYSEQWLEWESTQSLFRSYCESSEKERYIKGRVTDASSFVSQLSKYAPIVAKRMTVTDSSERNAGDAKRPRGYVLPPLAECRESFEEVLGQPIAWSD